jgi:hypothetical protein
MTAMNRRHVLGGFGIAALASLGAVGMAVHSGGQATAMRGILERLLGPFIMTDDAFEQFVGDFTTAHRALGPAEADLLHALEIVGPVRGLVGLRPELAAKLESLDRKLLTEFTLATELTAMPDGAQLAYRGLFNDYPCTNPYARLSQ